MGKSRSSGPAPITREPNSPAFENLDQKLGRLDDQIYEFWQRLRAGLTHDELVRRIEDFIAEHSSLFPNMSSPGAQEVLEWLDPDGCLTQRSDALEPYFNAADYLWLVCDSMPLYLSHCDTPTNRTDFRGGLVRSMEGYLVRRGIDLPEEKALPPSPQPLTEAHQAAYNLICEASARGEGLSGRQICRRLAIDSGSNFTAHYVPELRQHGIRNRRGLGYYHPDFYKPGPTL